MKLYPNFPPAFQGLAAGPANPVSVAVAKARRGVDAGLMVWSVTDERLQAALVLAPDVPLIRAAVALPACAVGAQNALGALSPPEVAVHLEWTGAVRLNGARAGALRMTGPRCAPDAVPDWLVVSLQLDLTRGSDTEPGQEPDRTALDEEGCGDLDPVELTEAWARHSLYWLNELEDDPAHTSLLRAWNGLAWNMGKDIRLAAGGATHAGRFLGVDENFGLLLKCDGETRLIPLADLIEEG